jgi:hypothetical protein
MPAPCQGARELDIAGLYSSEGALLELGRTRSERGGADEEKTSHDLNQARRETGARKLLDRFLKVKLKIRRVSGRNLLPSTFPVDSDARSAFKVTATRRQRHDALNSARESTQVRPSWTSSIVNWKRVLHVTFVEARDRQAVG